MDLISSAWTAAGMTSTMTTWDEEITSSSMRTDITWSDENNLNTTPATAQTDADSLVTNAWDTTVSFITDNENTLSQLQFYNTVVWITQQININKYFGILPVSILCNIMCLAAVYSRAAKSTVYFYIANMAVWDILSPCFKCLLASAYLFNWVLGDAGCCLVYFAMYTSHLVSVWLVVLLTVDRLVAVFYPFKLQWVNTIRHAGRSTIVIVICSALISLYNLWGWKGVALASSYICLPKQEQLMNRSKLAYIVMYSLIPTMLLSSMNTALFIGVNKKLAAMKDSRHTAQNNKVSYITIMAMTATITFLVLTGPFSAFTIASFFWDYQRSTAEMIKYLIIRCASILLTDGNSCINLVIYAIAGKRFRQDVVHLFGRIFGHAKNPSHPALRSHTSCSSHTSMTNSAV